MLATMLRTSVGLLFCISTWSFAAPSVAFYYGANPPWEVLRGYDVVVVEPEHGAGAASPLPPERLFAYVSAGEIESERPYAKALPAGLVTGANEAWRSHVIDQTHPQWPAFFVERIVAPLWQAGFRGFFLDTLDSFQLIATNDEERARQAQGLTRAIRALRERFPEAKLIFNRGFEILPALHREVHAVAAESLFLGWDQKARAYRPVPEADRKWLLGQLERVRTEYGLPVIAIDYAPPQRRELARETARRIASLGFVPWVTNAELDMVGVGASEIAPRRVLMLYDSAGRDAHLYANRIRQQAKTPFDYLGYAVDYADVNAPLPAYPLVGRYAGIVSWFADDQAVQKPGVRDWLLRQREHGMRMAVLGSFPFPLTDSLAVAFGLSSGAPRAPRKVSVEVRDPLISADARPAADRIFTPLRANRSSATLLRLRADTGETMDAAALMPWGGYVLTPYESEPVPGAAGDRWLIQPVEFMRRALALTAPTAQSRMDGRDCGASAPLEPQARASSCRPESGRLHTEQNHGGATRYGLKQNASERLSITCAS